MNRYKTVANEAVAEQVIEKSRFIAHVKPVETKDEADRHIAGVRAGHRDADHNVPAVVIGDKFQLQWASDDGEPQGTSGAPIVQMLVKEGVTNVAVVVTRYFGGVKLGTGGLVRAYTGSAKLGLAAAGVCQVKDMSLLTVRIGYEHLNKIKSIAGSGGFEIMEVLYEDKTTLKLSTDPENSIRVKSLLDDISSGACALISESLELVKVL
ncbi:MAG: YigZ family protein [Clostridiales bacterium]|nr:YigZ family protein [Clostridiales bacterium]